MVGGSILESRRRQNEDLCLIWALLLLLLAGCSSRLETSAELTAEPIASPATENYAQQVVSDPDGNIFAVFVAGGSTGDVLRFQRYSSASSQRDGRTVTGTVYDQIRRPQIAMGREHRLHLIWLNREEKQRSWKLQYRLSEDDGRSWLAARTFSAGEGNIRPVLLLGEDGSLLLVYAAQQDESERGIRLHRSPDGGRTWADIDVDWYSFGRDIRDIAGLSAGQQRFLSWVEQTPEGNVVAAAASSDSGATWSEPVVVSDTAVGASSPQMRYQDGRLFLVWTDSRAGKRQVYLDSYAQGRPWSQDRRILDLNVRSLTCKFDILFDTGPVLTWLENDSRRGERHLKLFSMWGFTGDESAVRTRLVVDLGAERSLISDWNTVAVQNELFVGVHTQTSVRQWKTMVFGSEDSGNFRVVGPAETASSALTRRGLGLFEVPGGVGMLFSEFPVRTNPLAPYTPGRLFLWRWSYG